MFIIKYIIGLLLNISTITIFFGIPVLTVGFFIRSLYAYIKARKINKEFPGTFSGEEMKKGVVRLVISSIMMAILVACVIGFIWLMYMAVAYM
jgi:hypothetical protein